MSSVPSSDGFPGFHGDYVHRRVQSNGYHSSTGYNSMASTPVGSTPSTPPALSPYRRPLHTLTKPVDPSAVTFRPSSPLSHPYENPILTISSDETREALEYAAQLLKSAQCVAFPTETVYGLGADATNTEAVLAIYASKSRPADNPLIVHIASLRQLRRLLPPPFSAARLPLPFDENRQPDVETIPEVYLPLIKKFWPGPLTILLPLPNPSPLSPNVTSTQPTFAARMPGHPVALALAAMSDLPLAAPSANASGKPSPTTAKHVDDDLHGRIPLIIDGGSADVGLESTVVDGLCSPPVVLRPGGVSVEEIRECGGVWSSVVIPNRDESYSPEAAPRAPGMKYKHYSPRAGVVLYDVGALPPTAKNLLISSTNGKVGILRTRTWKEGFAQEELRKAGREGMFAIVEESLGRDGKDIGHKLFRALRELDEKEVDVIHVEGIEEADEGLAVMNRLGKAASVVVRNVR
jgi:L-threonylcarbamoyladenylate synthase